MHRYQAVWTRNGDHFHGKHRWFQPRRVSRLHKPGKFARACSRDSAVAQSVGRVVGPRADKHRMSERKKPMSWAVKLGRILRLRKLVSELLSLSSKNSLWEADGYVLSSFVATRVVSISKGGWHSPVAVNAVHSPPTSPKHLDWQCFSCPCAWAIWERMSVSWWWQRCIWKPKWVCAAHQHWLRKAAKFFRED